MTIAENRLRDRITGQFAFDGDMDRICRCGHSLGVHVSGGFDCINRDVGDGVHCECERFRPVSIKPTEAELRLLREVLRCNDHPEGFRSYVVMGSGSKASNFSKISMEKRAAALVRKGHLVTTAHGYEITGTGRAAVDAAAKE